MRKWEKTRVKEAIRDVYEYARKRLPHAWELKDVELVKLVNTVRHQLFAYWMILASREWRKRLQNYEIVEFKEYQPVEEVEK